MIEQAAYSILQATDALAILRIDNLTSKDHPLGDPTVRGELVGPRCTNARTLAAVYPVTRKTPRDGPSSLCEIIIPDPCYWTPELPFLYDLTLYEAHSTNPVASWPIGVRRLQTSRRSLRLENRRYVVRGAVAPQRDDFAWDQASAAESALWIAAPSTRQLSAAAQAGVWVAADLRATQEPLAAALRSCAWSPSVAFAVLACDQLASEASLRTLPRPSLGPPTLLLAQAVDPSQTMPEIAPTVQLLAIELQPRQRPPDWLTSVSLPIVAMRSGMTYADLSSARRGCDVLQAELAPTFNLAGYFTTLAP